MTRSRPYLRVSTSTASTPFWNEITVVSGPTAGAIASAAASVSQSFTPTRT